jgi:hypothetical protein
MPWPKARNLVYGRLGCRGKYLRTPPNCSLLENRLYHPSPAETNEKARHQVRGGPCQPRTCCRSVVTGETASRLYVGQDGPNQPGVDLLQTLYRRPGVLTPRLPGTDD